MNLIAIISSLSIFYESVKKLEGRKSVISYSLGYSFTIEIRL